MKTLLHFPSRLFLLLGLSVLLVTSCKIEDPTGEAKLSDLSGTWVRIQSNNPSSDFMVVEVTGDRGVVTNPSGSGYSVGDVKWQNLTPSGDNTFDYGELGSDGNYYDAVLTLLNDSTIDIDVANSGAGNTQRWVKEGTQGTGAANQQPITLDCNAFTSDITLTNSAAAVDYIITCVMDVTADVVIEPGVVIEVEENGGIGVYDAGTFKAVGTATQPIVIRGTNAVAGFWRGIHIETNSINNQLEHVTISDAGSNYVYCCNEVGTIFLKDGKLSIKNTTLRNGAGYGIVARSAATFEAFEANTITTHEQEAMYLPLLRAAELDGLGSDYTGNDEDFILISDADVNEEITVPETNVPYLVEGNVVDIIEPLAFDPGAELVFKENGGLGVYDDGALALNGTAAKPVVLRGEQALKGFWRGIHIETNSSRNVMTYAEISDAGSNYIYCCNPLATVFLKGGRLEISNSTLSNGAEYGLYANTDANLAVYSSNTITTHDEYPLYLAAERFGDLDGMGSSYTGNAKDFVALFNSDIDTDVTWPRTNVPYFIETNVVVDIKSPLSIEAGTDIAFGENAGLGVYDSGTLSALGDASNPIIFRGREAVKGYWRGIHIETNSADNAFDHVELKHAGSNYVYCCNDKTGLYLKSGQATVTNSSITDNDGCGIVVKAAATLTESGNTFSNNTDGNICN